MSDEQLWKEQFERTQMEVPRKDPKSPGWEKEWENLGLIYMYCMFGWDKAKKSFFLCYSCFYLAVVHYCQALQGQIQPLSLLFMASFNRSAFTAVLSLYFSQIVFCLIMSVFDSLMLLGLHYFCSLILFQYIPLNSVWFNWLFLIIQFGSTWLSLTHYPWLN